MLWILLNKKHSYIWLPSDCKLYPCLWRIKSLWIISIHYLPALSVSSIVYYDPHKKIILDMGTSRPCGKNHNRISIHAEQRAISFCRNSDKRNRYQIFIWRYSRDGSIKPAKCCNACSKLITKYKYQTKIFTFENKMKCCAIPESPEISLGYKILHNI